MPRPKIIDDAKLTELFKQGNSLKTIAKELNVSRVAIHKRIKRLGLSQLPESLTSLTEKEKGFVMAVAEGQSRTGAVMQVYDVTSRESAKALGKTLMKDSHIRIAIDEMRNNNAKKMEQKGIGLDFRIDRLGQHMNSPDPVVSLKALDMGFKLSGDEQEAKQQIPEKMSFTKFDLNLVRSPASFDRTEGACTICKAETTDSFCPMCVEKYPVLIDKIIRHWNGDKCATCSDDRRCYEFCKACKESEAVFNHEEKIARA